MDKIFFELDIIEKPKLKTLILEGFKSGWEDRFNKIYYIDIDNLGVQIGIIAVRKGYIKDPRQGLSSYSPSFKGREILLELLNEFVSQNVLFIDVNNAKLFWGLTEYGKNILKNTNPTPHDPDGYISLLTKKVPNIDSIALKYIEEGIAAYNKHLMLSSIICLGCAAEKLLLNTIDVFANTIATQNEKEKIIKSNLDNINSKFRKFRKNLEGHYDKLSKELADNLDIPFNGLYEILRKSRNDTAHPTGYVPSKEEVFAALNSFIIYAQKCSDLIECFKSKITANE